MMWRMFETLLFIWLCVPGWSWVFTANRGDPVAVFGARPAAERDPFFPYLRGDFQEP